MFSESLYTWFSFLNRYRWAFIGGASAGEGEVEMEEEEEDTKKKKKKDIRHKRSSFKPHIIRLARLLNMKVRVKTGALFTIHFQEHSLSFSSKIS